MKWGTALKLGRVSNLPTVWSNTAAAIVLAGAPIHPQTLLLLGGAMSLFYSGGMFLNDAFDCKIDAVERPERPIPSGETTTAVVAALGSLQLALGVMGALFAAALEGVLGIAPLAAALGLCACIVWYNADHKGNPWSPLLMALCRLGVYTTAAFSCTQQPSPWLWIGGACLVSYLVGLTYVAKQETLLKFRGAWPLGFLFGPFCVVAWRGAGGLTTLGLTLLLLLWVGYALSLLLRRNAKPQIGKAVISLIAGIALLDSMLVAGTGASVLALVVALAFPMTLLLQRWVSGT